MLLLLMRFIGMKSLELIALKVIVNRLQIKAVQRVCGNIDGY